MSDVEIESEMQRCCCLCASIHHYHVSYMMRLRLVDHIYVDPNNEHCFILLLSEASTCGKIITTLKKLQYTYSYIYAPPGFLLPETLMMWQIDSTANLSHSLSRMFLVKLFSP